MSSSGSSSDEEEEAVVSQHDQSSTASSSDDDNASEKDIDDTEIRMQQMRRAAREKGSNRLKNKLAGLKTYDQALREHATARMVDGLTKLLSLHSGAELSAVCGRLGLKCMQKGETSIKQILAFVKTEGTVDQDKVEKLFGIVWDGAVLEYLRSIGHPVSTEFLDPKLTLMNIWTYGDIIKSTKSDFTPHFVVREVKKRYAWMTNHDILHRLDDLQVLQEKAKQAERKVIVDSDYTSILQYFQTMNDLRHNENLAREFFIAETEQARARVDAQLTTVKISQDELRECEELCTGIADTLNFDLYLFETMVLNFASDRCNMEFDLNRITNIVDSYTAVMNDRATSGGGKVRPLQLMNEEDSLPPIRDLHSKVQTFFKIVIKADNTLRKRARGHVKEIDRLESYVRDLEQRLEEQIQNNVELVDKNSRLESENAQFSAGHSLYVENNDRAAEAAWRQAVDYKLQLLEVQERFKRTTPLMVAGIMHYHPLVSSVCHALANGIQFFDKEEMSRVVEGVNMDRADALAKKHRKFIDDRAKSAAGKKRPGTKSKGKGELASVAWVASVETAVSKTSAKTSDSKDSGKGGKGGKKPPDKAKGKDGKKAAAGKPATDKRAPAGKASAEKSVKSPQAKKKK